MGLAWTLQKIGAMVSSMKRSGRLVAAIAAMVVGGIVAMGLLAPAYAGPAKKASTTREERAARRAAVAKMKDRWVSENARFTREFHPGDPIPTKWAELPAKMRSPRIARQLAKIAVMPQEDTSYEGAIRGVDPARQIVRSVSKPGWGSDVITEYRGGQGPGGGQSWMFSGFLRDTLEDAPLEHFFEVGPATHRKTGEPLGKKTKRLVYPAPKSELERRINEMPAEQAAALAQEISDRGLDNTTAALLVLQRTSGQP